VLSILYPISSIEISITPMYRSTEKSVNGETYHCIVHKRMMHTVRPAYGGIQYIWDDKNSVIGAHLEYASDCLKDDKEMVIAAVKENGRAHRYASYYL